MPIVDDQRRLAEKGRIRLGHKKTTSGGKQYPAKLETFRLTSADRRVIEAAAELYGGTAGPWEGQWEVVTDATDMAIAIIPAVMEYDSYYENWSGGACRSRCNGTHDKIRDVPCTCDPDNRTCKSTTRIQVLLLDLPALGTWRLETHGYYARIEFNGVVDIIRMAGNAANAIPARLRLENRTVKRLVGDKIETRNFVVPVIDLDVSARQLAGISGGSGSPVAAGAGGAAPLGHGQGVAPPTALPAGETPAGAPTPPAPSGWRPVNADALPEAPFVSVADQMGEVAKARKPRKNAAAPIKPTGMAPRTAGETICHICQEPYGDAPLVRNPDRTDGNKFVHKQCASDMETKTDPPASPGGKDGGGGGKASGPLPAGPAPAARGPEPRAISHDQLKKLMAVTAEAFPIDPKKVSSDEAKDMRRANVIALAAQLGITITSRNDLNSRTGSLVIDALVGIADGTYRWVDDRLIEAATGEVVTP